MQPSVSEAVVDELMRRVSELEAEKQRWKRLAMSSVVFLVAGLLCGLILTAGAGIIYWGSQKRHTKEIELMENELIRARQELRDGERKR